MPAPYRPQSLNRYSYVVNNPINAIDPTGHICVGEPEECLEDDGTAGPGFPGGGGSLGAGNCSGSACQGGGRNNGGSDGSSGGGPVVPIVPLGQCSGVGCLLTTSFPPGPSCTYANYCYVPSEEPEPYPGWPDYYVLEGGAPVLWIIGVDVAITVDKYKRVYFGIGPSVGTSPVAALDVNVSLSAGYIQDENTTSEEAKSFISKWSGNGCGGVVIGLCGSNGNPFGGGLDNENDWAVQGGFFTPQVGVAFPYSTQIYPK